MKKLLVATCCAAIAFAAMPAHATFVADAQGDWAPGYTGTKLADLDVKSFSVDFDGSVFHLKASMWGDIVPGSEGFYVIGVNTGTGTAAPFGALGHPNVKFNTAFQVRKNSTSSLAGVTVNIVGDTFWADLPLSSLPASTGFTPEYYGFNLWPRGLGVPAVSDFAPENSTIASVPEASTWAMMIAGFAAVGSGLRSRNRRLTLA
jgi:hypothetical protein